MPRSSSSLLLALPISALVACSEPPKLQGTVVDVWGEPIAAADIQVEGMTTKAKTDPKGAFSLEEVPAGKRRIVANKDGFIKDFAEVRIPTDAEQEDMPTPKLELYPQPNDPGFYLVGKDRKAGKGYHHLEAVPIKNFGTKLGGLTGLPKQGQANVPGGQKVRFVFQSTLRTSELSQMGLQLHKLKFVEQQPVTGALGKQDVEVNLWLADAAVEFDLKGLPADDHYLIVSRDKLKPGVYAFHTEDVLTAKSKDALENTPKEMRVAWPFEVK